MEIEQRSIRVSHAHLMLREHTPNPLNASVLAQNIIKCAVPMLCRCPGYVTALRGACGLGMRLLTNLSVLHHMGVVSCPAHACLPVRNGLMNKVKFLGLITHNG